MKLIGVTVALVVMLAGCAAFKKDVKDVAKVCRPEVLPDALAVAPYVGALIMCEVSGTDCTATLATLKEMGKADAVQCALAEAHAATVKLATVDAGAAP